MHLLFWIGFLFLVGYVSGVLSERFRLPKVTGYLLVGLLLSPSVSGLLPWRSCSPKRNWRFSLWRPA
ncbi:MAG: hypothetical protein P8Y65_03865 [Campylobacterales bacterium]